MKAVLLAACLGSRLCPIINEVPKCMVPLNGIRLLTSWMGDGLICYLGKSVSPVTFLF